MKTLFLFFLSFISTICLSQTTPFYSSEIYYDDTTRELFSYVDVQDSIYFIGEVEYDIVDITYDSGKTFYRTNFSIKQIIYHEEYRWGLFYKQSPLGIFLPDKNMLKLQYWDPELVPNKENYKQRL
jgi:hypothetical protein